MNSAHITALVSLVWLMAVRSFAGETATAVATVTAGFVTGITVTSGGSGYVSEPAVTLSGGGGSGATGKVILSGDKVAQIVVLTAGNGYMTSPTVTIDAPPKPLGLKLELVPKLTVEGPPGSTARIDWSTSLAGPWTIWTNLNLGTEETVLVDLEVGSTRRFYRTVHDPRPNAPIGFVWIPAGTFAMGSPETELGRWVSESLHTVTITWGFWLGDHEVTQQEYESVMGLNPSRNRGATQNYPVEQVTWYEAIAYCQKLTEIERLAGRITDQQGYRLPTEAEWEYACRAGTTGPRYGDLSAIAWWGAFSSGNSGNSTHPVKQKLPNAWGVYDMIGNVIEWCSDYYSDYSLEEVTDPKGPPTGINIVIRGGHIQNSARSCRSAYRFDVPPDYSDFALGFRVALSQIR